MSEVMGPLSRAALLVTVCELLATADTTIVRVDFDGSGDSGDLQDIILSPKTEWDAAKVDIERRILITTLSGTMTVRSFFEQWAWEILDGPDIPDWVNNDGGYGHIDFDLAKDRIEVEVNVRETRYDTHEYLYDLEGREVQE